MRWIWMGMLVLACSAAALAQHDHDHGASENTPVERPRIFLDKSPRVVEYQLKRLDNERLLLVERSVDDPKYAPVYKAILLRAGMSPQYREEALHSLVALNQSTPTKEVIAAIETLNGDDRQQARTASEIAKLLLARNVDELKEASSDFDGATQSSHAMARSLGYAGLISALQGARAKSLAKGDTGLIALLNSLELVRGNEARNGLRPDVLPLLDHDSVDVRRAAVNALSYIPLGQEDTFQRLAPLVRNDQLRSAAVRTLLTIPGERRDQESSAGMVKFLVELAEKTSAEQRTTDDFLNAMQLADQLFARIPVEMAREYRQRLREVTVRVVKIHTVEEEMRYDTPYFVVESGRPVQVVLINEDLMPHNLVITTNGSLEEVAELGLAVGPNGGYEGKEYVPHSDKVLFATNMVPPEKSERLTFTAPSVPGDYPYVCTFPRHWMRMYGVMLVVDDLDAWLQNPVPPQDPLGSTRSFVKSWTVEDFKADLARDLGAPTERGKQLFSEATCALCHKTNGEGGAVGPDLNGVFVRWKGDRQAVLREILEPSHRIDSKYAVHLIVTDDGRSISGIVTAEDKKTVTLVANPESKDVTTFERDSIEEMVKTSTSMMPKGLLDRFTRDEVIELFAYLAALQEN